jgi:hypothetical protein
MSVHKKGKQHKDRPRHWTVRALTTVLAGLLGVMFVMGTIAMYSQIVGSGHGFTWIPTGTPIGGLASFCTAIVLIPIILTVKAVQDFRKKKHVHMRRGQTEAEHDDSLDRLQESRHNRDGSDPIE